MEYNIREAREEKGMRREELAVKCNVSVQTIVNWENDTHQPNPIILKEIKRILA